MKHGKEQLSVAVQIDRTVEGIISRYILLLAVRAAEGVDFHRIIANGPAIWGGCVTRQQHRPGPVFFSQKTVTVQGGYGVLFAVREQVLLRAGAVAVQVL